MGTWLEWKEVFQDMQVRGRGSPFQLYTVSDTTDPVTGSGGLRLVLNFTGSGGLRLVSNFTDADAPPPQVVVVPAQSDHSATQTPS